MVKNKENENKNIMEQKEHSYRQYDTFLFVHTKWHTDVRK